MRLLERYVPTSNGQKFGRQLLVTMTMCLKGFSN